MFFADIVHRGPSVCHWPWTDV